MSLFPDMLDYAGSNPDMAKTDNELKWTIPSLEAHDEIDIQVEVGVPSHIEQNTLASLPAWVLSATNDPDYGNNHDTVSVRVRTLADLAIRKSS